MIVGEGDHEGEHVFWFTLREYSRPLVIYCDCAGEEASKFLATRLIKNGYKQENIFILRGGWYKWLELGYPVEKGKSQNGEVP